MSGKRTSRHQPTQHRETASIISTLLLSIECFLRDNYCWPTLRAEVPWVWAWEPRHYIVRVLPDQPRNLIGTALAADIHYTLSQRYALRT